MTEENASKENSNKCGGKNKAMLAYGVIQISATVVSAISLAHRFWSLCCEAGEQSV